MRINFAKNKKSIPPKEELVEKYNVVGETIASLAKHYGISDHTMKSWLCYTGIPRKSKSQNNKENRILKSAVIHDRHA